MGEIRKTYSDLSGKPWNNLSKGRPRVNPLSLEEELTRLRAENEYLKKLWALKRGRGGNGPNNS